MLASVAKPPTGPGGSPAWPARQSVTKSTTSATTSGSRSSRRWPRPEVTCSHVARPGRRDRRAVGDRDRGVVAVVDDQRGRHRDRATQLRHVHVAQRPDPALGPGHQAAVGPLAAAEHPGEPAGVQRRAGQRSEHREPIGAQPVAQRDRRRGGAHRVGDDRRGRALRGDDRLQRLRELRDRGGARAARAGAGLAVARCVERDDPEAAGDQRRNERAELAAVTGPTVEEVHGRAGAPDLPGDGADRERRAVRVSDGRSRRPCRRLRQGEPDPLRPAGAHVGRGALEDPEGGPHRGRRPVEPDDRGLLPVPLSDVGARHGDHCARRPAGELGDRVENAWRRPVSRWPPAPGRPATPAAGVRRRGGPPSR